jgi:hypothetical protein
MTFMRLPVVLAFLMISTAGCGGGGGGATVDPGVGPPGLHGIALPAQVSALPTSGAAPSTLLAPVAALLAPPADSDYALARTRTYVDERALSQFDVLNTIFNAVGQTNYADLANVNMGPYAAIVSWVKDDKGTQNKVLQNWIVDSRRLTATSDNVVLIWMPEMEVGQGTTALIRAHLVITTAPTQNPDGSYSDFGVWRLDADAPSMPSFSFTATAGFDPVTLHSVVKLSQQNPGNDGVTTGILSKGASSGFGKVNFPDYSSCNTSDCVPAHATASYAYDATEVKMSKGGTDTVKARNDVVDIVNRYALFDAVTGVDAAHGHTFGFPFSYGEGGRSWGGYQAWQGRHGIWANGATLPANTTVVRGDRSNLTYTTSDVYRGVLVKRTLADSTLAQVVGAISQTNLNFNAELTLVTDLTWWSNCNIAMTMSGPGACTNVQGDLRGPAVQYFGGFAQYAYDPAQSANKRFVNMWVWNPTQGGMGGGWSGQVVYLNSGTAGAQVAGFYRAAMPPPQPNGQQPVPAPAMPPVLESLNPGARVNLNVNENAWISYTGQVDGWVKKSVLGSDQYNNPTFDPLGDVPFTLETNREYYLNDRGVNYVVTFDGSSYAVKVEQQQVANPVNAAAMLEGIASFRQTWGNGSNYTFDLATMMLKSGTTDVTTGLWGLTAYDVAGQALPAQFNWEYPMDGTSGNMGVQQFLLDGAGHLVVLDDPIRMQPQQLADGSGATKTYSVVFDGSWVGGLPEIWNDLQAAGFDITPAIKDKVVTIPSDLVFTDAADPGKTYLFKPLEVSQYLMSVSNYTGALDTTAAGLLDLASVPAWQDWGMSTTPPAAAVKYSEGKPVQ